jgi:hypothetical protein
MAGFATALAAVGVAELELDDHKNITETIAHPAQLGLNFQAENLRQITANEFWDQQTRSAEFYEMMIFA